MKQLLFALVFFAATTRADTWDHHKSNLQKYSTEVEVKGKELRDLIAKKKHGDTSPELLKQIDEKHKEGEKSLEEYNKEVEHVKYRHPEREAEDEIRSYSVSTPRMADETDTDIGVDGKLDKVKQKMKRQYGDYSAKSEPEPLEGTDKTPKKVEPQRIIIKK